MGLHLKKKGCVIIFIVLVVIFIIGIVLLVVGSMNDIVKKEKCTVDVVVDGGPTSTRLIVNKYKSDVLEQEKIVCEDKGGESYSIEMLHTLEQNLLRCFENSYKLLPSGTRVPLFFAATGNSRIQKIRNKRRYRSYWTMINKTLVETTRYSDTQTRTLTGRNESKYSWIAANLLTNTLHKPNKVGMIQIGSSSVQIAFTTTHPSHNDLVERFVLDGKNFSIYRESYLCFGTVEIQRRILAEVVTNVTNDPCTNKGYNRTVFRNQLFKRPCTIKTPDWNFFRYQVNKTSAKKFSIVGSGDANECLRILTSLIYTNCTSNSTTCGINKVFQPEVHGKFLVLPTSYSAPEYVGLPINGSKEQYWKNTVKLCAKPYHLLNNSDKDDKYKSRKCLDSVLTYFLLDKGFKFDNNTWNINNFKQINGKYVDWSSGYSYFHRKKDYRQVPYEEKGGNFSMFVLGIFLMVVVFVFFIILFITFLKKREKTSDYEINEKAENDENEYQNAIKNTNIDSNLRAN